MRAIPLLIISFLLLACSGGGIGGAPVGGGPVGTTGGAVGGNENLPTAVGGPLGAGSAGAQPLDSGFSEAPKDLDGMHYSTRNARGQVICRVSNGEYRVKLSGVVMSDDSGLGVAGYLVISDYTAQRNLITRTSNDAEPGSFSTYMTLRSPYDVRFAMLRSGEEPEDLETLKPFSDSSFAVVILANAVPAVTIDSNENVFACVEAAKAPEYHVNHNYDFQPANP